MRTLRSLSILVASAALLTGCSYFNAEEDPPLPGERISVLELQKELEPDYAGLEAQGFIAPSPWQNEFWPQAGGYPNHAMQHLSLADGALKRIWSAGIGTGSSKTIPLTAQPVVAGALIFTLDADSTLSAFSVKDGKRVWQADVHPKEEDEDVIGGGIAFSGGYLYVTTGYDEVLSLMPEDGKIRWRVSIPAPSRAAPTVQDERIFVTTLDNRTLALSTADGAQLWEFQGLTETAGLVGAASPAADKEIVVPAYSSGEIYALRVENGSVAWSDNLSSVRRTGAFTGMSAIRGMPVIDKGLVMAISFGGRMVGIDERTGSRVWQREVGGAETPWAAGNHVFVITSDNKLVALARDTGAVGWVGKIGQGKDDEPALWTGPVLAGGRLILAGSNGKVMEVKPENGEVIRSWSAGDSVTIPPIVAGDTLYILTDEGELQAYR